MPKRLVDGDALARSRKLKNVEPPAWRAEIYGLLTLAGPNGVFDADPDRVWADLYSYNRPDWDREKVAALLDEFGKAKMLFRWSLGQMTWGFFVGANQPGRLPPASRVKHEKQPLGPDPPLDKIADWKADEGEKKTAEGKPMSSQTLHGSNGHVKPLASHTEANGNVGFGLGFGFKSICPPAAGERAGDGTAKPAKRADQRSAPGFAKFWEGYPAGRRVDRKEAERAWKRLQLEEKSGDVINALSAWKSSRQWQRAIAEEALEFIPHPATWLNKRRFEELPTGGANQQKPEENERVRNVECDACGGSGTEFVDGKAVACRNIENHRAELSGSLPGTADARGNS